MKSFKDKSLNNKGFTIIELALVMVIGGVLLATLSSSLLIYLRQTQIKTTEQRLEKIEDAIQLFLSLNGRLPCAASLTDAVNSATFGVEVDTDCPTAGAVAGTTVVNGANGRSIRIGAVPTRTINLPDDFMADAWGQRFTYAVTEVLTSDAGTYNRTLGDIGMLSSAGVSLITPADSGHYVIISHGNNGLGATTLDGVAGLPCPAPVVAPEDENCDGDADFVDTLLTSQAGGANQFDDHVSFRATSVFGQEVPQGAVMAFNLNACPQGWQAYAAADGRSIIGAGTINETYTEAGKTDWTINDNYLVGDTGGFGNWREDYDESGVVQNPNEINPASLLPSGSGGETFFYAGPPGTEPIARDNRPPYVALLYCEKL